MYFKIVTLFWLFTKVFAFYGGSSVIEDLNSENFNKLVKNAKEVWLVEFYAPWCGHCKSFASEYEKAAKALNGVIKVGSVNADDNPTLLGEHGVQGFPTIKIFNAEKGTTKDYDGERKADALVSFTMKIIQNKVEARLADKSKGRTRTVFKSKNVKELTDGDFDELVLASQQPWLVVYYSPFCEHCQQLASHWPKVESGLKNMMKLGAMDGTFNSAKTVECKVTGYPTILFFPPGKKEMSSGIKYSGKPTSTKIVEWTIKKLGENEPLPEIIEIIDFETLKSACEKKSLCLISILPHILDCQSKCRNEYLDTLKNVSLTYQKSLWGWVWSQAHAQPDLEEAIQIGGAGYPAMVAVNINKMRYSVFVGSFAFDGINEFLRDLSYGVGDTKPITLKEMPHIYETDPWNGEDVEDDGIPNDTLPEKFDEEDIIGPLIKSKDEL